MKKRLVTSVTGKMDCLTVNADAPVRPLFATDLRPLLATASALEGCRWDRTSSLLGSISIASLRMRVRMSDGKLVLRSCWSGRKQLCSVKSFVEEVDEGEVMIVAVAG